MGTAIVVTSGKGGTGKTSITGGVAGSLARLGHSVLCIDMDIGLRNLDISLGLSDRALMDFSDVAEGRCPLVRAAVNHPDLPGLALLTAPMTLSPALTEEAVRRMLDTARSLYDYVLIDSPAGRFSIADIGDGSFLVKALEVCQNEHPLLWQRQFLLPGVAGYWCVHFLPQRTTLAAQYH